MVVHEKRSSHTEISPSLSHPQPLEKSKLRVERELGAGEGEGNAKNLSLT
jgi:hypothetical protein